MKDNEVLKEIQRGCLILLKEFDRVCTENNIEYSLDAGTLLGAVRHKGFIPWDDDADVCVTRENYNKLLKIRDKFGDKFKLVTPLDYNDGTFLDCVPRLLYLDSRLHKDNEDTEFYGEMSNHLWLDIFIMDEIYKPKTLRYKAQMLRMYYYYGQMLGHRRSFEKEKYSALKGVVIFFLGKIGKNRRLETLYRKYADTFLVKGKKDYCFGSTYSMSVSRFPEIFPRKYFQSHHRAKFEDAEFYIIDDYHDRLTYSYGDYMTPPSAEVIEEFYNQHGEMLGLDEGFYVK